LDSSFTIVSTVSAKIFKDLGIEAFADCQIRGEEVHGHIDIEETPRISGTKASSTEESYL